MRPSEYDLVGKPHKEIGRESLSWRGSLSTSSFTLPLLTTSHLWPGQWRSQRVGPELAAQRLPAFLEPLEYVPSSWELSHQATPYPQASTLLPFGRNLPGISGFAFHTSFLSYSTDDRSAANLQTETLSDKMGNKPIEIALSSIWAWKLTE